jgi:psiF repeat
MRYLIVAAFAVAVLGAAHAQTPSCTAAAAEKKLAGAALKSFMGKCEREAGAACSASAKEKKLAGAAQKSFQTKCVADKVGKK